MVVAGEWKNIPLSTLSQALQQNGIAKSDITIIANATVSKQFCSSNIKLFA